MMTVSKLMKQLKEMPPGAQVGVAHGDNYDYEVAGWVFRIECHNKCDTAPDTIGNKHDRAAFNEHPKVWVTLHC
jgi:hypothetical protein